MKRKFFRGAIGAAGLSLLISCGYPALTGDSGSATAQVQPDAAEMTLARLESVLQEEASDVEGGGGQWQLTVGDRAVVVLADEANNRMRIVSPIAEAEGVSGQQVQAMLLANFHTALDARYALSENTVVAVFVHPLTSLDEDDLRSALSQVATLANNFGTTYSSGVIDFGPGGQSQSGGDRLAI